MKVGVEGASGFCARELAAGRSDLDQESRFGTERKREQVCKPDSVPPASRGRRPFLWAAELLPGSSDLPESRFRPPANRRTGWSEQPLLPYLVLLRVGFSLPRMSPYARCALTLSPHGKPGDRTFSPLPRPAASHATRTLTRGGIFSVALSVPAQPSAEPKAAQILAVSQHTALRSPDFPPSE
jgi:hypothetical protein